MWWGDPAVSAAEAPANPAAAVEPEEDDIKEQFEMQQDLIKQLKDVVKSHQTELKEKERQVQKYASSLSRVREEQGSRLAQLSQQVARLEDDDDDPVTSSVAAGESVSRTPLAVPSAADTSLTGDRRQRIDEIKRQMQQQKQVQEERERGQRADLEAMVRQLQERIEDTDYRFDSCEGSVVDSGSDADDMDYATSPRKSTTLSDSVRDKSNEELYGILLAKENKIYELSDRLTELETTVVDLKESLQEKESVIGARTAAVNLVTQQLTHKGRVTLDTLDETRQQMRQMQEAFAVHEADWRVREERLTRQLQEAADKLEKSEANCRTMELGKFDLVVTNANLQERLVKLQTSSKTESGRAAALHSQLAETRRQLAESEATLAGVKALKRKQLDQLELENGRLTEQLSQLGDQQLADGSTVDQLTRELTSASERITSLEASETALTELKQVLEDSVIELQTSLADKDGTIHRLQQQLTNKSKTAEENGIALDKMMSEKANLEVQISDLTDELATARNQLDDVRRSQEQINMLLEAELSRADSAEAELQEVRSRLQSLISREAEESEQLRNIEAVRQGLEGELLSSTHLVSELKVKCQELELLSTGGNGERNELVGELAAVKVLCQELERDANEERSRLVAEIEDLQNRCQQLQDSDESRLMPDVAELEVKFKVLEELVNHEKEEKSALVSELMQLKQRNHSEIELSNEIVELRVKCQELESRAGDAEHDKSVLVSEINDLKSRCKELSELTDGEKSEKVALSKELDELKERCKELEKPAGNESGMDDLKKLAKKLKVKLKLTLQTKSELEQQVESLRQELSVNNIKFEELQNALLISSQSTADESLKEEAIRSRELLASAEQQLEQMQEEVNRLKSEMAGLSDVRAISEDPELSASHREVLNQIQTLSDQLHSDDADIQLLLGQLDRLDSEVQTLTVAETPTATSAAARCYVLRPYSRLQSQLMQVLRRYSSAPRPGSSLDRIHQQSPTFDLLSARRTDRSSSQSSLFSERSGPTASYSGDDPEKDALLLKQQTKLRQLVATVRRRTEQRDAAVGRCTASEEALALACTESDELRAKLEDVGKQLDEARSELNEQKEQLHELARQVTLGKEANNRLEASLATMTIQHTQDHFVENLGELVVETIADQQQESSELEVSVRTLMSQLRNLSPTEVGTLFTIPSGEEVVSLPSTSSGGSEPWEVVEDNMSGPRSPTSQEPAAVSPDMKFSTEDGEQGADEPPLSQQEPADDWGWGEEDESSTIVGSTNDDFGGTDDAKNETLLKGEDAVPSIDKISDQSENARVSDMKDDAGTSVVNAAEEWGWEGEEDNIVCSHGKMIEANAPEKDTDAPERTVDDVLPNASTSGVDEWGGEHCETDYWQKSEDYPHPDTSTDVLDKSGGQMGQKKEETSADGSHPAGDDNWRWTGDDEDRAAEVTSGQWGWEEDAGWPAADQQPSEALRLGAEESSAPVSTESPVRDPGTGRAINASPDPDLSSADSEGLIRQLTDQLNEVRAHLESAEAERKESFHHLSQVTIERDNLRQAIATHQQRAAELEAAMTEAIIVRSDVQQSDSAEDIETLRSELLLTEERVTSSEHLLTLMESEKHATLVQLTSSESKVSALQNELNDAHQTLDGVRAEVHRLEAERAAALAMSSMEDDASSELQARLATVESQLASTAAELEEKRHLSTRIDELESQLTYATSQVEHGYQAAVRVAELEQQVVSMTSEYQQQLQATQSCADQLEVQLSEASMELEKCRPFQYQVFELESQLQAVSSAENEKCQLETRVLELEADLTSMNGEMIKHQEQLSDTRQQLDETNNQLDSCRFNAEKQLSHMNLENVSIKSNLTSTETELAEMGGRMRKAESYSDSLMNEVKALNTALSECQRELNMLKNSDEELRQVRCQFSASRCLMERMVGELWKSAGELERLEKRHAELTAVLVELREMKHANEQTQCSTSSDGTRKYMFPNAGGFQDPADAVPCNPGSLQNSSNPTAASFFTSVTEPVTASSSVPVFSMFGTSQSDPSHTESDPFAVISDQTCIQHFSQPSEYIGIGTGDVCSSVQPAHSATFCTPSDNYSVEKLKEMEEALTERNRLATELIMAQRDLDAERQFKWQMERQLETESEVKHQLNMQILESESRAEQLELNVTELQQSHEQLMATNAQLHDQLQLVRDERDLLSQEGQKVGADDEERLRQVQQDRELVAEDLQLVRADNQRLEAQLLEVRQELTDVNDQLKEYQSGYYELQEKLESTLHEHAATTDSLSQYRLQCIELQTEVAGLQRQCEDLTAEAQTIPSVPFLPSLALPPQEQTEPPIVAAVAYQTTSAPLSSASCLFSSPGSSGPGLFGTLPNNDPFASKAAPPPSPVPHAPSLAEDIGEQVSLLETENSTLREELRKLDPAFLQMEIERLNHQVNTLNGSELARVTIEMENHELKAQLTDLVESERHRETLINEVEHLKIQMSNLNHITASRDDLATQNTALKAQLENLASVEPHYTQLADENKSLRTNLIVVEEQLQGLQTENIKLQNDVQTLLAQVEEANGSVHHAEVKSQLEHEQVVLSSGEEDVNALRSENDSLRQQTGTLLQRVDELSAQLQTISTNVIPTTDASELQQRLNDAQQELESMRVQLQQYVDWYQYYSTYSAAAQQQPTVGDWPVDPSANIAQPEQISAALQHWPVEVAATAGQADLMLQTVGNTQATQNWQSLQVSTIHPDPTNGQQQEAGAAFRSMAQQMSTSDRLASTVTSAAQGVIPSVLSFFAGASSAEPAGHSSDSAAHTAAKLHAKLTAAETQITYLRDRVNTLERAAAAAQDPLAAPVAGPFLEETAGSPPRSTGNWEEFSPILEGVASSEHGTAFQELATERQKVAILEEELRVLKDTTSNTANVLVQEPESSETRVLFQELATERQNTARLESELLALKEISTNREGFQVSQQNSVSQQLTEEMQKVADLENEMRKLKEALSTEGSSNFSNADSLLHELKAERIKLTTLQEEIRLLKESTESHESSDTNRDASAADLETQLTEQLMEISQLNSDLELERTETARLQIELSAAQEQLQSAESQLMAVRHAPLRSEETASAEQLDFYRQKVADLETDLTAANTELQKSKVKSGRLLQKVKTMQKEAESRSTGGTGGGGIGGIDTTMLDEIQRQSHEWQRRADEADRYCKELQQEKIRLTERLDTFQDAHERLVDSKELLDAEVTRLRLENDQLRSTMSDMQWKLAELEELTDGQSGEAASGSDLVSRMLDEKMQLERRLVQLESDNEHLLKRYEALGSDESPVPGDGVQRSMEELQMALDASQTDNMALGERLHQYESYVLAMQQAAQTTSVSPEFAQNFISETCDSEAYQTDTSVIQAEALEDVVTTQIPDTTGLVATAAVPKPEPVDTAEADDDAADSPSILRSREAIIHSMADELQGQRATNAALSAELAHWRSLAEEGEDGDVVHGLSEQLRQLYESLRARESRCQELTTEVAQLLEERDQLQLRLSSSLRLNQHNSEGAAAAADQQFHQPRQPDIIQLQLKLAELKKLNYLLDIQLQGEISERRRLQRTLHSSSSGAGMMRGGRQVAISLNTSELVESSSMDV